MSILSHLLTGGPSSPFYQALVASNIGLSYAPGTGYDHYNKETSFSVGISDILESDVDRVEQLILDTLAKSAEEGFPEERIESILHQIEYGQKHVSSGFGLNLVSSLSHSWIHGGSPTAALTLNEYIVRLRSDLASGPFLQNKIKTQLIQNNHRLTFVMVPDAEYSSRLEQDETASLAKLEEEQYHPEKHSQAREKLEKESEALEERQEQEDDVSILPKIKISEVDRKIKPVPITKASIQTNKAATPIQWTDQPTNGIAYFRASLDINSVPADLMAYVPLFATTLHLMGAGPHDYMQLAQQLELTTGGFNVHKAVRGNPLETGAYDLRMSLYSSALRRNLDPMFDAWEHVLTSPRFQDTERLKTLVGNVLSSMQSSMVDSGHSYASTLAMSALTGRGKVEELWGGVHQFNLIKSIHEAEDLTAVAEKLQSLAKHLFDPSKIQFAVNAEKEDFAAIEKRVGKLVETFPTPQTRSPVFGLPHERITSLETLDPAKNIYFGLQSQVNYVTRVFKSVPFAHKDYSTLDILGLVMGPNFLHKEIREKGGAYGSGLSNSGGTLTFYSYRDPNVEETLETFQKGIDWIVKGEFNEEHIEEAKLQILSNLDSPIPPCKKGLKYFDTGIDDTMTQTRRDRVFAVTRNDIIEAGQKYFGGSTATDPIQSAIAVFGSDQNEKFKTSSSWIYREK